MASQADVLSRCLQEAAQAARPALERCIDHAVAALQVAETQSLKVSERDDLARAWRELQRHRDGWSAQYPGLLLAAFSQPAKPAVQPVAARKALPALAGADMFSLVDDTQVEEGIESSRLLQQVAPMVEQSLAELDGLMSAAQGLVNVRAEANPVRPDVYTQTLRTLLLGAPVAPTTSALWIKHLGEPLGRELKRIYERLINVMELAQVRAASYRVLQSPASAGKKPGSGAAGGEPGAQGGPVGIGYASDEPFTPVPSHYADLSNHEVKDALFQDFLLRGSGNADHGLAPAYYATIEEELIALKGTPDSAQAALHAEPPAGAGADADVDDHSYHGTRSDPRRPTLPAQDAEEGPGHPSRIVDVLSQLSSQVWGVYGRARERALVRTQLKKDATRVGQVLGMEVVKKLVNQVAQDPRLLVPVREAIVALEPSLLRLAMVDSRFFSEENHPARRLMERVAQRSFNYNDERSPAFDVFFHSLTEAFNGLNALEIEDARPFDAALGELQALWDEQDRHEKNVRGNMRQTMQFAEERQAQADQIALDMSLRADLDHVPGVVLDFLFGPWALVMAHARLTDTAHQIDPQGYGSLVTDLLWSVKRQATLKRPGKLITMIPGLLAKLQAGLTSLGLEPGETEAFFNAMERLHRPVLKLRRVRSRRDAVESDNAPLEVATVETDLSDLSDLLPATPEQRKAKAAGQPWLAPQELDRAGFEDTLPSGPAALDATPHEATPVGEAPDRAADDTPPDTAGEGVRQPEDILMGLREGSWVDLHSRRHWLRAQLIWASTRGTLFMFVSHGGQPHSMTKRSCVRLITQGLLRPVETHDVVAHALDHLVNRAAPQDPQGNAATEPGRQGPSGHPTGSLQLQ
ncbi:DUF1631 family protein [Polaromonas sp.]|uniref:DUF1631 family protein n=1 Tax=Polaromonas sp. TaxID=1869339 RepID=UPI002486DC3F|nr:DUF1631 family protein [Polaromonas sp.]MDI1342071.1 DUF1631 family protein [Polaromonas sp.]